MKALIIAAGNGSRLQSYTNGSHKCLTPLLGLRIIERIILSAKEAGINEFVIVTGYEGKSIKGLLKDGNKYGVSISYVKNNNWKKANGISVLKAKQFFTQHFVLLMADHIFAIDTLRRIQRVKLKDNESILAIDKNLDSVLDIDDTTKIIVKNNRIISLNKKLSNYNGFDTGMFVCSPYVFKALEQSTKNGINSLSDAMRIMVKNGQLKAFDIRDNYWADCDTHADLKFAEKKLMKSLTKPVDGIVSKHFNRKISGFITKTFLIKTPITPNMISYTIPLLIIPTFWFLSKGTYPWILFGGLLVQLMSIIDGCDGEIARLKFLKSKWGGFLDTVIDRYIDIVIVFGMIYGYWITTHNETIWFLGFFVVSSLIMDIFISREIKVVTSKKIKWPILNVKRDTRLLIFSLGAITNQVFLTMIMILLILNFRMIYQLVHAKKLNQ